MTLFALIFSRLIQNKLLSIDAELEKDLFKGLEMRGLNDSEEFTSQVL